MAAFLSAQLDFIFFFYGLAFLLLGVVSFAIARGAQGGVSWVALGVFGFVHGTAEWLDLLALIVSDNPTFAIVRTAVMTASFVCLVEAARLELIQLNWTAPGRWVHLPLLFLVAMAGQFGGLTEANIVARYAIGLVGAMGMALALALHARIFSGRERSLAAAAAVAFALYAIASGAIVPAASFWPASVFNYAGFSGVTGVPIQFVRGLLAVSIVFTVWGIWGQKLIREVSSPRYTKYLQQQFVWTLAAMAMILLCGWVLTEYLGGIYRQNVQDEARGDLDLVMSRLAAETNAVDSMVKVFASSPVLPELFTGRQTDDPRANSVLQLTVEASAAKLGYLLGRSGIVIASTDRRAIGRNDSESLNFQDSIAGNASRSFVFDATSGKTDYDAGYPVRDANGKVLGVAVLKKSLSAVEADLSQFDRPYFLVDPNGIVVLTNKPKMMLRALWPLPTEMQSALSLQFGSLNTRPVVTREITDSAWIVVDGERDYVRRRFINHSEWSLVMLSTPQGIVATRVLGIIITLLMAAVTLVYIVGRERWVHDTVQMDKRLELEELARNLDLKASTDSMTGVFNRLKFNQELAVQISRARRYGTSLSLILYDVDRFKGINDTYGHQAGDKVLIRLAQITAQHIRNTDVHARWGGEEFVILATDSTSSMASQLAENLRRTINDTKFDDVGEVTCSFGVAQFAKGDTAETLVARADTALYRAKINGRNRVEAATQPQNLSSVLDAVA